MSLLEVIIERTGIGAISQSVANNPNEQLLIASLLALVAKSDGGISPDEIARMVKLLRQRFGLAPVEALDLVSRAAEDIPDHDNVNQIVISVNESLSRAQKEDLMFMILCVIAADNQKDAGEMKLLSDLINGLRLSDEFMEKVYERYFDGMFY